RDLAYYTVRPRLSRVAGVARVEVMGTELREISVVADPARLQAAHLGLQDVKDALARANMVTTVGRMPRDYKQYLVLASGALKSLEDIRRTVVAFKDQSPITVGDLCTVDYGIADPTILIATNGRPGVLVNISRQIGGNILQVTQDVKAALRQL